ncbi:MFS transporter [Rathayibacter caricis]|uniref:MFS transporter n=1 Tax=Rathayibacter caricis TaxID=110936 RepID=UPI001FB2FD31|nr:MFS transporter [Rathayibacter caricis]MCJ1697368.1 MFS transporter [Rathayibacter caricis]
MTQTRDEVADIPDTPDTSTSTEAARPQGPSPAALVVDGDQPRPRRGLVPILALSGIAVATMQTLTVPLVADLPRLLDADASDAAWVITATLLSGTVAAPVLGRLGDLYGKRRLILITLGLMVLGSLLSGMTSDLVPMIIGRAVQGFALGAIPLGIGIIWEQVHPDRRNTAVAIMSSSIGIGGALAIPAAALVAQYLDWHWLFFGTAALGVIAMIGLAVVVTESPNRASGRFDLVGALGLTLGLVALLLAVSKGGDWGWASPVTLGLFGAALVVLLLWGLYELRVDDPLLDLRSASRRQVLLTNLSAITVGLAFFAITLVLPQLLQLPTSTGYGMGLSLVAAGLCGASMGLAMMVVAPLAARLSGARGPKTALILGLAVLAVAYLAGTVLLGAVWQLVLVAVLAGAGVGIAYAAMPALILGAVDPAETGAANGLNSLMRSIGTATSSAVIGVVLASTAQRSGGIEVPTLEGFRIAFLIAAGAAVIGLVLAAFLPRSTQRR